LRDVTAVLSQCYFTGRRCKTHITYLPDLNRRT
jgi:hypothetical protein